MTTFILTMLDTSNIQPYVFGSNRLQENIGASEQVYRATSLWAFDALNEAGLRHNVRRAGEFDWQLVDSSTIEGDPNLDAEVVYAGGGNTLLLFRPGEGLQTSSPAQRFTQVLTRKMLAVAPGLTVVAQHLPIDWESERLSDKRLELLQDLARHKQARLPSTPLLGLGVTTACESTGLPAVRTDAGHVNIEGRRIRLRLPGQDEEKPRAISPQIVQKLGWRDFSNRRLEHTIGSGRLRRDLDGESYNFEFPSQVDKLGRALGEESYVGVVHADGNRMGEHVGAAAKGREEDWQDTARGNRECVRRLRDFSEGVNEASRTALGRVVTLLMSAVEWSDEDNRWEVAKKVPLEGGFLPFRPLVFGGDDVTFLCNARLALALTAEYLAAFEEETARSERRLAKIFASAGVAMVKMHYPFARAYDLSVRLCASAKALAREGEDCSAFDWHFATSGLSGSLKAIRAHEYQVGSGILNLRPLRLHATRNDQSGRYWDDGLERVILDFQEGRAWEKRRNKVKGLREPLRLGPQAVESYRQAFDLPVLPVLIPGAPAVGESGWSGERCVYFDAIELMDHYSRLEVRS